MRDIFKYSKKYEKLPFEEKMVEVRRKEVIAFINKYPHAKISELGCGLLPLFLYFDDYQEMHVVEPALNFYNNAKEYAKGNPRVTCYNGYAEDYAETIRNLNIDILILSGVLHEVENAEALLTSIRKMCSPDTALHINVPNAHSVHRILAKEMGLIQSEFEFSQINKDMQQHSVFSLESLCKIVEASGFTVQEKGSYFIKPFTHEQMEQCISHGIITKETLMGLSHLETYMPGLGAEIFVNCVIS